MLGFVYKWKEKQISLHWVSPHLYIFRIRKPLSKESFPTLTVTYCDHALVSITRNEEQATQNNSCSTPAAAPPHSSPANSQYPNCPCAVIITSTFFPKERIFLRLSRQVIEVVIHFTVDLTWPILTRPSAAGFLVAASKEKEILPLGLGANVLNFPSATIS